MGARVLRAAAVATIAFILLVAGVGAASAGTKPLVWVALEDDDQVALVNVRTERVLRRVSTPGGPHNITVAKDGTVVTALWGSNRIAIVGAHARFVTLGGAPHDVKISGRMIVIANQGDARIDRVRLSGDRLKSVPLKADPHDLAVSPSGRRAWVSLEGTDDMAIVNIHTRHVGYFSTGVSPHDLLFAPDGRLWVTDWNGGLHVFKGRDLVRTLHYGREAHHLAFTPDGEEAWTTDEAAEKAFVLTVRPVDRIDSRAIPGAPHHVTVTANGRWVVVADHVRGTLVVFDADTHHRVRIIDVGDGPHGVWAVPKTA
jgi:DNA-binding beta-propeller fold protein YncE